MLLETKSLTSKKCIASLSSLAFRLESLETKYLHKTELPTLIDFLQWVEDSEAYQTHNAHHNSIQNLRKSHEYHNAWLCA